MEGVTIIETKVLQDLISNIQSLQQTVKEELTRNSDPYLTTKDVCRLLKKSENWVLLHKDDLGSSKRTGTLLFKRSAIDAYIEQDYFQKSTKH